MNQVLVGFRSSSSSSCSSSFTLQSKEYIERRHGEPFKFLFLPKMGLLGSQAVLEKKSPILYYEQLFSSVFSTFHGQNFIFSIYFLHCSVCTKKLLNKKVKKIETNFGRIFFGLKTVFLGLAVLVYFGFSTYRVSPWLLSTVSLANVHNYRMDLVIKF